MSLTYSLLVSIAVILILPCRLYRCRSVKTESSNCFVLCPIGELCLGSLFLAAWLPKATTLPRTNTRRIINDFIASVILRSYGFFFFCALFEFVHPLLSQRGTACFCLMARIYRTN